MFKITKPPSNADPQDKLLLQRACGYGLDQTTKAEKVQFIQKRRKPLFSTIPQIQPFPPVSTAPWQPYSPVCSYFPG